MKDKKSPRLKINAPFDAFATPQNLYVDGDQKTSSWFGFACTLVLSGLLMFVAISEIIVYSRYGRSRVYINELILSPRPSFDISERKFFMVFRHSYTGGEHYSGLTHKMVSFDLYYNSFSSEIGPLGYAYQENLFEIKPTPCDKLQKIELTKINYSP